MMSKYVSAYNNSANNNNNKTIIFLLPCPIPPALFLLPYHDRIFMIFHHMGTRVQQMHPDSIDIPWSKSGRAFRSLEERVCCGVWVGERRVYRRRRAVRRVRDGLNLFREVASAWGRGALPGQQNRGGQARWVTGSSVFSALSCAGRGTKEEKCGVNWNKCCFRLVNLTRGSVCVVLQ